MNDRRQQPPRLCFDDLLLRRRLTDRERRPVRPIIFDDDPPRKRKMPPPDRRRSVTVCAAAICTVGDKTIGGWKYAIIGVSDRMFTANNIETEPRDQTKIHYLGRKVVALGAGDVGINYAVTEVTRHQVKESAVVDVPSIASWQAKNYADYRQKHLECRYLADYGLTMDSFIAR